MHTLAKIVVATAMILPNVAAESGRTLTSWDCCKPACAWDSILKDSGATGRPMVCNKNDQPFSSADGAKAASSCGAEGTSAINNAGYLCSDYSPRPVAEDFSYGFVITDGSDNCCKCFEFTWTNGPAKGKRMQVQSINEGGSTDGGRRDFILLTPGGGTSGNDGCKNQWGGEWGRQNGGVQKMQDCENLPSDLQGGCYWRWNWAKGDVNTWAVDWKRISCPEPLTAISGCSA